LYKEGTNHAVESGHFAALAVAAAKAAGDFSRQGLAGYERRLQEGVALQDVRKYRDLPDILEGSPELLSLYPKKVTQMLVDFFTVSGRPKRDIQKEAVRGFFRDLPKLKFVRDSFRARKLL
jgi:electron transfer flavoprotein-quinone oxidoreductase